MNFLDTCNQPSPFVPLLLSVLKRSWNDILENQLGHTTCFNSGGILFNLGWNPKPHQTTLTCPSHLLSPSSLLTGSSLTVLLVLETWVPSPAPALSPSCSLCLPCFSSPSLPDLCSAPPQPSIQGSSPQGAFPCHSFYSRMPLGSSFYFLTSFSTKFNYIYFHY